MSIATRNLQPEIMDDPALDRRRHRIALGALARINTLSRSAAILWPPLRERALRLRRPLRVLDVATGSGDVPIRLARFANRARIALDLTACDTSRTALAVARRRARRANVPVRLLRRDVIAEPPDERFDAVTCSLFLHHLTANEAEALLRQLATIAPLLLVNDLRRSPMGLALAWSVPRCLTRSTVVHTDATRSVRAAFTPAEIADLAARAGLDGAVVRGRWPWRLLLRWERR